MKRAAGWVMMSVVCVVCGCSRTKPELSVRQAPVMAPGFSEMDYRFVADRVVAAIREKAWPGDFHLALGPIDTSLCRLTVNGLRIHEIVSMNLVEAAVMHVSDRAWIDGQGYGQLARHGQQVHGVLVGRVTALDTPATHLSTGHVNEFTWTIVDPSNDRVMVVARVCMPDDRIEAEAAAAGSAQ